MKKIITPYFIFIIFSFNTAAQVDTTDWFPMQTGNYWEYMAWTIMGPQYFSQKIVGDTIMPNGKEYKIIKEEYLNDSAEQFWFNRKENNQVYRYVGDTINCMEYKILDFAQSDSSFWLTCRFYLNARGIASTFWDNTCYSFFQKTNEAKQFEDLELTSSDTVWTPFTSPGPIVLNRGLGIVWYFIFTNGSYYLQGAIINGISMGVFTDIEKEEYNAPQDFSLKSYPNPFNSTTNFQIYLPESEVAELSVYNILGQKVATLFDDFKTSGNYSIQFNANHLSSGVYLAVLQQNNLTIKQKIILLK
jgi:hypothetical protein